MKRKKRNLRQDIKEWDIRGASLDVRNEGSLKPKKVRSSASASINSGSKPAAVPFLPDS